VNKLQKNLTFVRALSYVLIISAFTMAGQAVAGVDLYNTPNCGGFDSCDDSSFLAAIGGGPVDTYLEFDVDKNGAPVNDATEEVDGGIYSNNVVFSTGANPLVVHAGSGSSYEIGPVPDFSGETMVINFASPASAVGMGAVEIEASSTIRIFNGDVEILTTTGASDGTFDYLGFVATNGDLITRIEITDSFWAIQNISFNQEEVEMVAVPTMSTWGMVVLFTLLAAMGLRYRRRV